jgi:hypothetical protein
MPRPFLVLLGLAVGLLLAGILAAVQLVLLPEAWRTQRVVGASSLLLVGACVAAALAVSRDREN